VERPFRRHFRQSVRQLQGFRFPFPEGTTRFAANDPVVTHLSIAQAHMPPTELVEVAGFTCTAGTIAPEFNQFDDGKGACLPPADSTGTRNDPIRAVVLQRLNGAPAYRRLFGALFPTVVVGGRSIFRCSREPSPSSSSRSSSPTRRSTDSRAATCAR
jgi:hypothetical protein